MTLEQSKEIAARLPVPAGAKLVEKRGEESVEVSFDGAPDAQATLRAWAA